MSLCYAKSLPIPTNIFQVMSIKKILPRNTYVLYIHVQYSIAAIAHRNRLQSYP